MFLMKMELATGGQVFLPRNEKGLIPCFILAMKYCEIHLIKN